jgi:5-deoxy-glucuronate isomerase
MAYPVPLKITPDFSKEEYIKVTPEKAAWEHLNFAARKIKQGQTWTSKTEDQEMVIVLLGGVAKFSSDKKSWGKVGRRPDVFSGMPYAIYVPRHTAFEVTALSDELDIGYGWTKTDQDHPMQLVTPEQVTIEVRGGDNVTRQINGIVPPGFDCHKLVVVEVFSPSGNWSSFPPHKHDHHQVDEGGNIVEADLEEIYFYKIDKPEGFAYQHIYTDDGRIDELLLVKDSELVLSPEGYHPVVSAPGNSTYYLNFLAGTAQVLTATDDPDYAWVKESYASKDPRVPLVTMEMEEE